jgi:hypothetical protein
MAFGEAPGLRVLLAPSQWDAVIYVRGLIEDPNADTVIDTSLVAYAEDVNEDFSRHVPLDYVIGDPFAQTSPLVTVKGQQRYLCSSGNGFVVPPIGITDVLYRAGGALIAPNEMAYLSMTAFAPLNRFLFTTSSLIDSPSQRVLRDEYIDEMDHYGRGYAGTVLDPSGVLAIDLFPTPETDGVPIYVRYLGAHAMTFDSDNNVLAVATIPEYRKRDWGKLFYATVLEQEGEHMARFKMQKAGLVERQSDARTMEARIVRIREEVYAALGSYVSVGKSSQ